MISDDPLAYAEWLAKNYLSPPDAGPFVLGEMDQTRLARALLLVLPVVRAAEAVHAVSSDGDRIHFSHGLDNDVYGAIEAFDGLIKAVGAMRSTLYSPPARKQEGLTLDEVKAALEAGGEERKAAERTAKRSPRR